jgi:predicted alpha/beta hydrolase family esterase
MSRDVDGSAVLFVHGGGDNAYSWDRKLADRLQKAIGSKPYLDAPKFDGLEALDWPVVKRTLGKALSELPAGAIVVAHSVGAAAVITLLSEGVDPKLRRLFLLAPPYEGADGEWGDDDFAFPADFAHTLPPNLPITLWHSRDDEIISVANAERYRQKLAQARVILLDGYGHQFEGDLTFLADAIHGALK